MVDPANDLEEKAIRAIGAGVVAADKAMIQEGANQMTMLALQDGAFSDSFLEWLLALLGSSDFVQSAHAADVFYACMANWDVLSEPQRLALLSCVERAYPRLNDSMAAFVVTEMIGTHYCTKGGLDTLIRMRDRSPPDLRASIPHGLELIALKCRDKDISLKAHDELAAMRSDQSEEVRAEVHESLRRLAAAYPPYPRPRLD